MSFHDLLLKTGELIVVEITDAMGGHVQTNVRQVEWDNSAATYLPVEVPAGAPASVDVPQATPAAVAHADATGVDLTTVEGTGKPVEVPVTTTETVPTITKADVQAAASAAAVEDPAPVEEPVNPAPVTEPTPTPAPPVGEGEVQA